METTSIIFASSNESIEFTKEQVLLALEFFDVDEFNGANVDEVTYQEMPHGIFISNPNLKHPLWEAVMYSHIRAYCIRFFSSPEESDEYEAAQNYLEEYIALEEDDRAQYEDEDDDAYNPSLEEDPNGSHYDRDLVSAVYECGGTEMEWFFTTPEIYSEYEGDITITGTPENWLFSNDPSVIADAIRKGSQIPLTDAQVEAVAHTPGLQQFALLAINEEMPAGFELHENGWLLVTNKNSRNLSYDQILEVAQHAQFRAETLNNLFDYLALKVIAEAQETAQ